MKAAPSKDSPGGWARCAGSVALNPRAATGSLPPAFIALPSRVEDNLKVAQTPGSACVHPVNLPNYITLTRICQHPGADLGAYHAVISAPTNGERELIASFIFIAASITDAIDGYLARKREQVTTMGMLLDPVADKLLIAAAFITLVQFNPRIVPAWMAVIIIGREFLVSGLRSIAASEGFTIQASDLGKAKMLVQIVSVVAAIVDHHWAPALELPQPAGPPHCAGVNLGDGGLSLISAADYFIAFWSKIDRSAVRRQQHPLSRRRRKRDVAAT